MIMKVAIKTSSRRSKQFSMKIQNKNRSNKTNDNNDEDAFDWNSREMEFQWEDALFEQKQNHLHELRKNIDTKSNYKKINTVNMNFKSFEIEKVEENEKQEMKSNGEQNPAKPRTYK